jgi:hypothetical protein
MYKCVRINMESEFQIDHLCFCRDFEFCNESLKIFNKCRNLDNAIIKYPILQIILDIYNNPNIDLKSLKLPPIEFELKLINNLDQRQYALNSKYFLDFIGNMSNDKIERPVKQFIKCLWATLIFDYNLKNFRCMSQALINTAYNKTLEFINKKDVYETFDIVSKLYNQDENLLDKYKKSIEPYVDNRHINPK